MKVALLFAYFADNPSDIAGYFYKIYAAGNNIAIIIATIPAYLLPGMNIWPVEGFN
ncbi:MAG: hypothetical protein U5L09_16900 [Bacteroidales bacterium]|nr:hypothetical protein [Bacteroidales bacterium]